MSLNHDVLGLIFELSTSKTKWKLAQTCWFFRRKFLNLVLKCPTILKEDKNQRLVSFRGKDYVKVYYILRCFASQSFNEIYSYLQEAIEYRRRGFVKMIISHMLNGKFPGKKVAQNLYRVIQHSRLPINVRKSPIIVLKVAVLFGNYDLIKKMPKNLSVSLGDLRWLLLTGKSSEFVKSLSTGYTYWHYFNSDFRAYLGTPESTPEYFHAQDQKYFANYHQNLKYYFENLSLPKR